MTKEERDLLETTARRLLKLQEDFADRICGMDIVLQELARHGKLVGARLKLRAELLRMKGMPSAYLDAFVRNLNAES